VGFTCLTQGNFAEAQENLIQALRIYDRDREAKFRFHIDTGASATAFLGLAHWLLGEVAQARQLIEDAAARAVESDHVPTLARRRVAGN
jgi:hypothetical protein